MQTLNESETWEKMMIIDVINLTLTFDYVSNRSKSCSEGQKKVRTEYLKIDFIKKIFFNVIPP